MDFTQAVQALDKFRDRLLQDEVNSYSQEYKTSKWYREPTLEDATSKEMSRAFTDFYDALVRGNCIVQDYLNRFDEQAHEFGRSWMDEDLHCMRTGYEFETEFYLRLRNIAADILGLPNTSFDEYYEGIGF